MKGSKIYLLWEVYHDMIDIDRSLVAIFGSKESANRYKVTLDNGNTNPVVYDDYGPIKGIEYQITTEEVK